MRHTCQDFIISQLRIIQNCLLLVTHRTYVDLFVNSLTIPKLLMFPYLFDNNDDDCQTVHKEGWYWYDMIW